MEFSIFFLLISALGIFVTGIARLFLRGRRQSGVGYIGMSLILVIASVFLIGYQNEKEAKSAGFESYEAQQAAIEAQKDRLKRVIRIEEANARARADAADEAAKEAHQARMAAKTKKMTERVTATLRDEFALPVESRRPDGRFCRDDGYCYFDAGGFEVNIYGAGIAEVQVSSQKPHAKYREVCAAVFSAISGSDHELAAEVIGQSFREATQQDVKRDVLGIQINIAPAFSSNLLACDFFQY